MRRPPPPGKFIDVGGGRRLHVRDLGEGTPAVVLEAGAGGWSSHWGPLPEVLAQSTRVLAYDRAGLGWSDPAPKPRSPRALADDLGALLDGLGIDQPVVLAGHSVGAALVRFFAHQNPTRSAGIVFVDGWHEAMAEWERSRGLGSEPPRWLRRAYGLLSFTGVVRLATAVLPVPPAPWPIDDRQWRDIVALSSTGRYLRAAWLEADCFAELDRENAAALRVPGPLRVLVAARSLAAEEASRGYPVAEHNQAWVKSSSQLAKLSRNSTLTVLEASDHVLHLRSPDVVAAAVDELVQAWRARHQPS